MQLSRRALRARHPTGARPAEPAHRCALAARVVQWLALALLMVYWGTGLPFTLLYINFESAQFSWVLIPYMWEVPILGFLMVLWPVWRILQPVEEFVNAPPADDPERARQVRHTVLRLPLRIPPVIVVASLLGYALGSVQLRVFGHLPLLETLKSLFMGLPTGLLYGLLAYFILTSLLRPVVELADEVLGEEERPRPPRVPLFWKAFACFLVLVVLSVTVMGLLAYTSSQRLLEANIVRTMESRLQDFSRAVESGRPWTSLLEFKGREMVALLDEEGRIVYYRGPQDAQAELRASAAGIRGGRGHRILREGETRIVVWEEIPPDSVVVAQVPFALYEPTLARELRGILLAAGVTLLVALLLAIVLARTLSRPVTALTHLASEVQREWPRALHGWHTDDEIGELGKAIQGMLARLRRGQEDLLEANQLLGQMVAERTRALQDLSTMLELSHLLSSSLEVDPVLGEALDRVRTAVGAQAAAVHMVERHHLVQRQAVGLDDEPAPRALPASHPPLRRALATGDPAILDRGRPEAGPLLAPDSAFQRVMAVPMVSRDQAVGLLSVYFREARVLEPEMVALLRSAAGQAGVALGKARLFQEKNRVTELLRSVLRPRNDLGFPGLDVGHVFIPSRDLSGDYFDLIPLSDRRVALVIADVAGKGSEAAIEAVRIKHTVQTYATAGYSPAALVRLLNEQMHRTAPEIPRMVTLFYAELDLDEGSLTFCSAGHEPPVLWDHGGREPHLLENGGIVLGAVPDAEYTETRLPLGDGSWLVLFTDGITEARAENGELFGLERLLELLDPVSSGSARTMALTVEKAVLRFTGGEVSDDLSLLVIRCRPVAPARAGKKPAAGRSVRS